MATNLTITETIDLSHSDTRVDALIERVTRKHVRVVVEDDGKPIAAIVSPEDLRRLQAWDDVLAERARVLANMRRAFADVPVEELEREAERALAEVRAEMRAERDHALATRR